MITFLTILIWFLILVPIAAHILWGEKGEAEEVIELDEHEDALSQW